MRKPLKRTTIKRKAKKDRRTDAEKDYYAWLATQPCVVTGKPCEQRHHARSLKLGCGMGLKVKDWFAMPLTENVHHQFHVLGVRTWELRYGKQETHIKRLWEVYGVDKIPEEVRRLVE